MHSPTQVYLELMLVLSACSSTTLSLLGTAKIFHHKHELFKWAIRIARRYMRKDNAATYGKRNGTEGKSVS